MKFNSKIILTIVTVLFSSLPVLSQAPPPPPATPIDGGLSLLLAAGGVYGYKKLRDKIKK